MQFNTFSPGLLTQFSFDASICHVHFCHLYVLLTQCENIGCLRFHTFLCFALLGTISLGSEKCLDSSPHQEIPLWITPFASTHSRDDCNLPFEVSLVRISSLMRDLVLKSKLKNFGWHMHGTTVMFQDVEAKP
ncbi:hypothetical protein CDAR_35491 [Caerostris darwini]|uniref:Uncharacterized protein n=1 Tax=Caerostris darwini TaxID=1538125 RepID=A0AAV4SS06_9ARAC|nr:hypothetical protein CDAR_35491 [Caerostris darwini]